MNGTRTAGGPPHTRPTGLVQRVFGRRSAVPTTPILPAISSHAPWSVHGDFGTLAGGALELRAASIRGLSHQCVGTVREDTYAYAVTDQRLVVAVADGLGSASHSNVGATIAVRTATALVSVESCTPEAIACTVAALIRTQADRESLPVDQFATTLAVLVLDIGEPADDWPVTAIQWGDDTRVSVLDPTVAVDGHPAWRWACPREDRDIDNVVRPLPMYRTPTGFATDVLRPAEMLLVATDGIDSHLEPRNSVGHGLAEAWSSAPEMWQFIADVGFERAEARDDRTAVCLFRPTAKEDPT